MSIARARARPQAHLRAALAGCRRGAGDAQGAARSQERRYYRSLLAGRVEGVARSSRKVGANRTNHAVEGSTWCLKLTQISRTTHTQVKLSTGAPGRIRTHDPLVRSQVLYPTELRARCGRNCSRGPQAGPNASPERCRPRTSGLPVLRERPDSRGVKCLAARRPPDMTATRDRHLPAPTDRGRYLPLRAQHRPGVPAHDRRAAHRRQQPAHSQGRHGELSRLAARRSATHATRSSSRITSSATTRSARADRSALADARARAGCACA